MFIKYVYDEYRILSDVCVLSYLSEMLHEDGGDGEDGGGDGEVEVVEGERRGRGGMRG